MPATGAGPDEFESRLDNAAKIFASQLSPWRPTVFRVAAILNRPISVEPLEKACRVMMTRCPYFKVHLRRGLFWYYLEPTDTELSVEPESRYPCLYIPFKRPGVLPLRVIAYNSRIAVEVGHFVTDGTGALNFLNGLIAEYLRIRGESIAEGNLPMDARTPMNPEEYEDGYLVHHDPRVPPAHLAQRALIIPGTQIPPPAFFVTEGIIESANLKRAAAKYNVTIGEYLTASLVNACYEEMKQKGWNPRPIRISVPVNLRRIFGSSTMRNFSLTVEPGIDPRLGDFSFEEIVSKVHHFMRMEIDGRYIARQISRNVTGERNPVLRILPLFLKDPLLKFFYAAFGSRSFTISFSNLGRISIPDDMARFVRAYQVIPPSIPQRINAAAIAYGETSRIFLCSHYAETDIERRFFAGMRRSGIPVTIKTNRR